MMSEAVDKLVATATRVITDMERDPSVAPAVRWSVDAIEDVVPELFGGLAPREKWVATVCTEGALRSCPALARVPNGWEAILTCVTSAVRITRALEEKDKSRSAGQPS